MKRFKRTLILLVVFLVVAGVATPTVGALDQAPPAPESESGSVICPPGVYHGNNPGGCAPLGPSEVLSKIAGNGAYAGIFDPAYDPDFELNYVPYSYFWVSESGTSIYPSADAAAASSGASGYIGPGFVYVSYFDRIDTGTGVVYNIEQGWIRGDGSRVTPGIYQGFSFSATPRTAFGWVVTETSSREKPDYINSNPVVNTYPRFTVLKIYAREIVNGEEWYQVGSSEWVEGRHIGVVVPNPVAPQGVENGRWIEIDLAEQTMMVYDNNELVYATLISSGLEPFWTRPGLFQIYDKKETEDMSGSVDANHYYLQDVPWTMYFDKARALHGAYWHTNFGYPQSHGCVNISLGDSNWLYHWAEVGDWVWVHDPSGKTPTDPAKYGEGGF